MNQAMKKKIAEIREALEKATPGPWAMIEPIDEVWQSIDNTKIATVASNQDADANLHLIANAPEWLRFLLSELEEITEQTDELLGEKAEWQVVADRGWHVAGEETKKNESLQQEIERLKQERDKL